LRVEGGSRGRKTFIVQTRLKRFREHLKRLQALDRITAAELIATFAAIEQKAYDNGYACCEDKWQNRVQAKAHARKVA